MEERKTRTRKLTMQDRESIVALHQTGMTGKRLSEIFSVSPARISQIVNNYYGEMSDE
tara:strand:- start:1957 stop:2130 length:174 start_codon:yes stop_codon:yes gene_type:complete